MEGWKGGSQPHPIPHPNNPRPPLPTPFLPYPHLSLISDLYGCESQEQFGVAFVTTTTTTTAAATTTIATTALKFPRLAESALSHARTLIDLSISVQWNESEGLVSTPSCQLGRSGRPGAALGREWFSAWAGPW